MNGMKAKAERRKRAIRFTKDGLPLVTPEWLLSIGFKSHPQATGFFELRVHEPTKELGFVNLIVSIDYDGYTSCMLSGSDDYLGLCEVCKDGNDDVTVHLPGTFEERKKLLALLGILNYKVKKKRQT